MFDREFAERMKRCYPAGTRIVCDFCTDAYNPIGSGEKGTVAHVDDLGTVHIDWDNGRRFGLVKGEDAFHAIEE